MPMNSQHLLSPHPSVGTVCLKNLLWGYCPLLTSVSYAYVYNVFNNTTLLLNVTDSELYFLVFTPIKRCSDSIICESVNEFPAFISIIKNGYSMHSDDLASSAVVNGCNFSFPCQFNSFRRQMCPAMWPVCLNSEKYAFWQ